MLARGIQRPVHVLAVDQARQSGWALRTSAMDGGRLLGPFSLVLHGTTRNTSEMEDALTRIAEHPTFAWHTLLVAFEDHAAVKSAARLRYNHATGQRPTRSEAVLIGLGAARGAWDTLLDQRDHPKAQRIKAAPLAWRRVTSHLRMPGDESPKDAAVRYCRARGIAVRSEDEAEAICMGEWASVDGLHAWAAERIRQRAERRRSADH